MTERAYYSVGVEPAVARMEGFQEELTQREAEILALTARGLSDKEIACQLRIASSTVSNHLATIYTKLHASNRAEAVAIAIRRGLLPSE